MAVMHRSTRVRIVFIVWLRVGSVPENGTRVEEACALLVIAKQNAKQIRNVSDQYFCRMRAANTTFDEVIRDALAPVSSILHFCSEPVCWCVRWSGPQRATTGGLSAHARGRAG